MARNIARESLDQKIEKLQEKVIKKHAEYDALAEEHYRLVPFVRVLFEHIQIKFQ